MKVDWVWDTEVVGWYINIDGTTFGPMKYSDIWNIWPWLTKAALLEPDHDEQQRLRIAFQKVRDLKRADWQRLLGNAQFITKHTNIKKYLRMEA